MTQFKKEILTDRNIVVHCPEEWQADELLKWADSHGKEWRNGDSFLNVNNWDEFKEKTCYFISSGERSLKEWCESLGYTVLSYEEAKEKQLTKTERIEQIEKESAELKAEVKAEEKQWPDSLEEAMEITRFWGFWDSLYGKYILCTGGPARGLAVNSCETWTYLSQMKNYWKKSGEYGGNEYYFKPFDTEKELKEWFLDEN